MKYLFLVGVLLASICVVDSFISDSSCPTPIVPENASITKMQGSNLKASCQCAPFFMENETVPVEVSIWFPGKNIIKAIKNRRHRLVTQE